MIRILREYSKRDSPEYGEFFNNLFLGISISGIILYKLKYCKYMNII